MALEQPSRKRVAQETVEELQGEPKTQRGESEQIVKSKRTAEEPIEQLRDEPKAQRVEIVQPVLPVTLQVEPTLENLPTDLRKYISIFLVTAEGKDSQEKLKNAAKNIRKFLMLNKRFKPLLEDINFAGIIITNLAKRYSQYNFVNAAIALQTQASKQWLSNKILKAQENTEIQNLFDRQVKISVLNAINTNNLNALKFIFDLLPIELRKKFMNFTNDAQGNSLLFIALKNKNIEIAKQLVEWGADPNFVNRAGESPMALAAELDLELLKKMQAAGGNIKMLTPRGMNLLGFAGNAEIAAYLIQQGVDVNLKNQINNTPLHISVKLNRTDVIKVLLKAGAKPNVVGENNNTPLHMAANRNNTDMVKILLDAGANPNSVGDNGDTPLFLAVNNDNAQIINMLLDKGADIEYGGTFNTALAQAVAKNNVKAVQTLLDRGANATKLIGNSRNNKTLLETALSYKKQPGIDTFGVAKAFVLNSLSEKNRSNKWNINEKLPGLNFTILQYTKKFPVTPETQSDFNDFIKFLRQHGAVR